MKKNRKNSKGYMLVEIILASTIAFALAYFMLELTLKLKEKNYDLLVATLMATDRTIISNEIMSKVRTDNNYGEMDYWYHFNNEVYQYDESKLIIYGKPFVVNKYAYIDNNIGVTVEVKSGPTTRTLHINVPLRIKTKPDDNQYDVNLYYFLNA